MYNRALVGSLPELEATASALHIQERPSNSQCRLFKDKFTGRPMRYIGKAMVSAHFKDPKTRCRVLPYGGVTPSDRKALLELGIDFTKSGVPAHLPVQTKRFNETGDPYQLIYVARPLDAYEGDELIAVAYHPDLLDLEISTYLDSGLQLPRAA